jgi:chromosome partitioning protein
VIRIAGADDLRKIVVINPKGGCGKTTLATNLASCYAQRGLQPTIIDCDPQGYGIRWLEKRPAERPLCYGIEGHASNAGQALELPADSRVAIIDLPSALPFEELHAATHLADRILLPITPSAIDVFSASRFVAELMLDVQLDRSERKLAIVANRVKARTLSFEMLQRFLTSLHIPIVATLRDSQVYVHAAARGLGICELPSHLVRNDLPQMSAIMRWLDRPRSGSTRARNATLTAMEQGHDYSHQQQRPVPEARRHEEAHQETRGAD